MNETTKLALVIGGIGLVAYVLYRTVPKVGEAVGGIVSGDNALTRNQTDAAGQPVTAYQGAGIAGTLGATANTASGGYLSSFGSWLGGAIFDLTHGDPLATTTPSKDKFTKPAATTNAQNDASFNPNALSFAELNAGASFKDLVSPSSINPFSTYTLYGT